MNDAIFTPEIDSGKGGDLQGLVEHFFASRFCESIAVNLTFMTPSA